MTDHTHTTSSHLRNEDRIEPGYKRHEADFRENDPLTKSRSDSVVKALIGLLCFLALLWVALSFIHSHSHPTTVTTQTTETIPAPQAQVTPSTHTNDAVVIH